jgi:hypothetical protein
MKYHLLLGRLTQKRPKNEQNEKKKRKKANLLAKEIEAAP